MENMCRTCMQHGPVKNELSSATENKMMDLYNNTTYDQGMKVKIVQEKKISLVDILRTIVPQLKLEQNDKLPKNICLECTNKLKEIHIFQNNCLKVERQLLELLDSASTDDENSLLDIFDNDSGEPFMKSEAQNEIFVDENSFQSDQFIDEDNASDDLLDINMDDDEDDDDFIESCSDLSIDFVLDEENESDFEDRPSATKDTNTSTKKVFVPKLYPCNRCNRKLKSELSLKKHLELHDKRTEEEPKYECHICNRAFSQAYMLRDHLRSHSGEKPFLCSECGKGFTTSSSLKQHEFRHQSEKLFSCPDCPKTFPTRTDLSSHYDIHKARPKSHICDVCGRGFPKPFLLKKHKMYHTNERRFVCEFCAKRFYTNEKLQRHTRIHTGEKPYRCKYCEKAYCQSNELTKHLRCHLGENVYQCQLCPQRFATVKLVKEHFSTHKNDDEETREQYLNALNAIEIKGIFCR